jgi:hypothetical protein
MSDKRIHRSGQTTLTAHPRSGVRLRKCMIPEPELQQYIARNIGYVRDQPCRDPEFRLRLYESLVAGLIRLNNLPPDDPFWVNTNGRPTVFKLPEYFARVFSESPEDEQARWGLIATQLVPCDNNFASAMLMPLVARDYRNLRWLVSAAEWVWHGSRFPVTKHLRCCLEALREADFDFDLALKQLADDTDAVVARTARIAGCVLAGRTIGDCSEHDYAPIDVHNNSLNRSDGCI